MPFYDWDSSLDLGVLEMNNEHKKIIHFINTLYDAHKDKKQKKEIENILNDLGSFTVTHFTHEEAYMEKIQFPSIDVHKTIHKELLAKLQTHVQQFQSAGVLSDEFFNFLKFWLTAHIKGIDSKYGQHAKSLTKGS